MKLTLILSLLIILSQNIRGAAPYISRQGPAAQLIVDGQPYIMLGGELHNSSASSLTYMEPVWGRLSEAGLNTVLATVSWELTEPEEGRFDFKLVDGLIDAARRHDLKLVLLWFGTWKNGYSSYVPEWVKTNTTRFARAQTEKGGSTTTLSAFCDATCQADSRCFAAFLQHLRKVDSKHTVLVIQVENETGIVAQTRDYSPQAQSLFTSAVPSALMDYLTAHEGKLLPELAKAWQAAGHRTQGTWSEVFGIEADEIFMAWHVAGYVGRVAAAGKAEYPLPMYANAWLAPLEINGKPAGYPMGGPVSRVHDIWRAAAPALDLLAPDNYVANFREVCQSYHRSGNPLFIPEGRPGAIGAANVFYALGAEDAICFSPFGIDGERATTSLKESYHLPSSCLPLIAKKQGTGQMTAFVQEGDEAEHKIELNGYSIGIKYGEREQGEARACGLVIALGEDEFLLAGANITFKPTYKLGHQGTVDYVYCEEGEFKKGVWIAGRRLNGDEYEQRIGEQPVFRHFKLFVFQ